MRLIVFFLWCGVAFGACPSDIEVPNLTGSWVQLHATTDTTGTATKWRVWYGLDSSLDHNTAVETASSTAASRWVNITDVGPGQKIYFDFRVTDAAGTTYGDYTTCAGTTGTPGATCPDGVGQQTSLDSNGRVYCEDIGAGQLMNYLTMSATKTAITTPTLPSHDRTYAQAIVPPTIDGSTSTVTVTGGACTDLQSILNDHGTSGTKNVNLNHKIVIPAGTICRAESESLAQYDLPARVGTGTVWITCGWDSEYRVPNGSAFTPDFRNSTNECGIEINRDQMGTNGPWAQGGGMIRAACSTAGCTEGWYFDNLVFVLSNWQDQTLRQSTVSSVDTAARTVTPAATTDLFYSYTGVSLNLPGITGSTTCSANYDDLIQRGFSSAVVSGGALQFASNACMTAMDGSYTSGGYVTSGPLTFEITSCSQSGDDVECTLEEAHRQGTFPTRTISSMTSGVVTVPSSPTHGITGGAEVEISGNDTCDGIYSVASRTSTTITLDGSTCSGSGGTIKRVYTGLFFDLTGTAASSLEGVRSIDYPSASVVRARNVSLGGGTITGGGYAATAGGYVSAALVFDYAKRITVARCYFDGHPAIRVFTVVALPSTADLDNAIIDNWFERFSFWMPEGPLSGDVDAAQSRQISSGITKILGGNAFGDVRFEGNTIRDSPSFAVFADGPFNDGSVQDFTMRRNKFLFSDRILQGNAANRPPGVAYNWRGHFLELKAAQRVLVDGLYGQGNAVMGTTNAFPMFFSYWVGASNTGRYMQDLTIQNVWLRDVAQGIGMVHQGGGKVQEWKPIARVEIDNLLFENTPWPGRLANPYSDSMLSGTYAASAAGGTIALSGPAEDIRITRTTFRRSQSGPSWTPGMWVSGQRVNGLQVESSIWSHSGGTGNSFFTYDFSLQCCAPNVTADGEAGFLAYATRMGTADTLSWMGTTNAEVGVIPCLTNVNDASPDFSASNSEYTTAASAWGCTDCTRWDVIVTGADSQSCATRESAVLAANFTGTGAFAALGHDHDELMLANGHGVTVDVSSLTKTGGTIGYTVPSGTGACTVDYSLSATFASGITRAVDAGTGTSRSATVSGLSAGQTVYYRVMCPSMNQVGGSFVLAS